MVDVHNLAECFLKKHFHLPSETHGRTELMIDTSSAERASDFWAVRSDQQNPLQGVPGSIRHLRSSVQMNPNGPAEVNSVA